MPANYPRQRPVNERAGGGAPPFREFGVPLVAGPAFLAILDRGISHDLAGSGLSSR
jgi:hypothetical protein